MGDNILEMKHIVKEFASVRALDDVTLTVKRGTIHAICGENGAGKSTLMNVLSGIYAYGNYRGDIYYNDELCKFRDIRDSETRGIVIIHQELALSPYMSIAENIFLGNEKKTVKGVIDWNKTRAGAIEVLHKDRPLSNVEVLCQNGGASLSSKPAKHYTDEKNAADIDHARANAGR